MLKFNWLQCIIVIIIGTNQKLKKTVLPVGCDDDMSQGRQTNTIQLGIQ